MGDTRNPWNRARTAGGSFCALRPECRCVSRDNFPRRPRLNWLGDRLRDRLDPTLRL